MQGIMIVNKPAGISSHGVVANARKILGIKKIGHSGTLDPAATGVLVLLVGKDTKMAEKFQAFSKAYRATMILGLHTDSCDTQGKVLDEKSCNNITRQDIEAAFDKYRGESDQIPPMFSAVKHKGKKLYQLARKGITVERKPRRINITALELEEFRLPKVTFYMECSTGTYVRQLADDIGKDLGCGACVSDIQRIKVGPFKIDDAIDIEDINESHIRDWKG